MSTTTSPAAPGSFVVEGNSTAEAAADLAEALLARVVEMKGGARREGQVQMARHVAGHLAIQKPLMSEGGTGTGKSIAYLVGAIAVGKQVVVAPHTKALQDQLADDLDLLVSAFSGEEPGNPLGRDISYAVVKGRSAYACLAKIKGSNEPEGQEDLALDMSSEEPTSELGKQVKALSGWADTTGSGDRSDLPFPTTSKAWEMVSVTSDDCAGKTCHFFKNEQCFAESARRRAKKADVIVVNQALLAMAMKIPHLLPDTVAAVVVDEAHEFPSVVADTFGAQVSTDRLKTAATKGAVLETRIGKADMDKLKNRSDRTIAALETAAPVPKHANRELMTKPAVKDALRMGYETFATYAAYAERLPEGDEDEKGRKDLLIRMYNNLVGDLSVLLDGTTDTQVVWVEGRGRKAIFRAAQFDVSDTIFEKLINRFRAVVFTSATLKIAGEWKHSAKRFGLTQGPWQAEQVSSPFDYNTQGMLYLPQDMPEPGPQPPKSEAYLAAVADVAEKVALAAGGRTLVLCTSRASVVAISEHLQETLGDKFPILVQEPGEPTKPLAQKFAEIPESILVGTRTFWTGVSTEGPSCSAVVLDKLPFPSPTDPIISARSEKADREVPRSGFKEVSLSEACLTVVQGSGRLIRTVKDRGVVVICDPRLHPQSTHKKFYGAGILRSLPGFPVMTDEETVLGFLRNLNETADDSQNKAQVEEEEGEAL